MLDLRGRSRVAPLIDPVVAWLGKMRLRPAAVTIIGLAFTVVGGVFISLGQYISGAAIASFGSLLDALDGPLARLQGTASDKGAFIDTMSDRFGEIAIWIGIAYSVRHDDVAMVLSVLALGASLLVPYVRAKAESWGAEGRGGWMGRAERLILAMLGVGLTGFGFDVLLPMLWAFVFLTSFTVGQRIYNTWRQLD